MAMCDRSFVSFKVTDLLASDELDIVAVRKSSRIKAGMTYVFETEDGTEVYYDHDLPFILYENNWKFISMVEDVYLDNLDPWELIHSMKDFGYGLIVRIGRQLPGLPYANFELVLRRSV